MVDQMSSNIENLQDSPHLLDILVQMEDVLDAMDLYVFRHWLNGEIVEGPNVRRYWLSMTLRYPKDNMPDPRGAKRLLKHGVRVDYTEVTEKDANDTNSPQGETGEESEGVEVWHVRISIPRRLCSQMSDAQQSYYEDDVDVEHAEDAKDDGMDDESAYIEDDDGDEYEPS
jgi:hypothetical protein